MFATLFIPNFHLQAQLRLRPEWRGLPVALLEGTDNLTAKEKGKARILQLTREAELHGVIPGITATRAQARCPQLLLIHSQPEDEESAREVLWDCAGEVTRDFEASGPEVVTLDLHGVRQDFQKLALSRIDWLRDLGLGAQAGLADNPDLAFLAARLADPVLVFRGTAAQIHERLAPLPVTALQTSPDWLSLFQLWGIQTIGDFGALPRHELVERLGPAAGRYWDQAHGCSQRLLRLVRAPEVYRETLDLEAPLDSAESLLFLLHRFLERISARLAAAHVAAGSLELILTLESSPAHRRTFRIPEPAREVEVLFRILQTHLERFTAPSPVVAIALEAFPTRTLKGQTHLFEASWKDPNRLADTLARVEALLGAERVGTPLCGLSHRPDTFRMQPFSPQSIPGSGSASKGGPHSKGGVPSGPPLRRFRPRRPIAVATTASRSSDRPDAILSGPLQGALSAQNGPWVSSGDWWQDSDWHRQEWDVRHESGTCYRLAQEGGKWFAEGVYD
jgi:protein ImuB